MSELLAVVKAKCKDVLYAQSIAHRIDHANRQHPAIVSFETHNRCTGSCAFCPVGIKPDRREKATLDIETIRRVCGELRSMGFERGVVYLNGNNEPLLDRDLVKKADAVAWALPFAKLRLHTNGDLLDETIIAALAGAFASVSVTWYHAELPGWWEYARRNGFTLTRCNQQAIRQTRGGLAPNRKCRPTIFAPCVSPFESLNVLADGRLALCCNDVYGAHDLGSVHESSVVDLWKSERYAVIRDVLGVGRNGMQPCAVCDSL